MNSCRVLFFASMKDRTGVKQTVLEIPEGSTVGAFKDILVQHYPAVKSLLPNALIAVNRGYAPDEVAIPSGAEIAIFPPVSGGSYE